MKTIAYLLAVSASLLTSTVSCRTSNAEILSTLGRYQGYSTARYDGYKRQSHYLNLGDGTRLAYDL